MSFFHHFVIISSASFLNLSRMSLSCLGSLACLLYLQAQGTNLRATQKHQSFDRKIDTHDINTAKLSHGIKYRPLVTTYKDIIASVVDLVFNRYLGKPNSLWLMVNVPYFLNSLTSAPKFEMTGNTLMARFRQCCEKKGFPCILS